MAKQQKHHGPWYLDGADGGALGSGIGHYLAWGGLSFDFDAGREQYDYRIGIGPDWANTLAGSGDRDYLWGRGGNDRISAGRESDNLYGDAGDDTLVGGAGPDRLVGGKGMDHLYGGPGNDNLMGGAGRDYLDEGAGHGALDGGPGDDILVGGKGPDAFMVSPTSGNDIIRDFTAGPGMFDHLALMNLRWQDLSFQDSAAGVKVMWGTGSVLLQGVHKAQLAQDDFMFAESPDLPPGARAPSGPAPERATPSTDGPVIGGHDLPGRGFDKFADAMLKAGGDFHFTFHGDETYQVAVGTLRGDYLNGTDAWDHFMGRDGNDTLVGNGGDDVLQGDAGNDILRGGAGNDKLDGGMGDDRLSGGAGEDELMGMAGNDYLDAGPGHDMIEGGPGNDTIRGGTGADAFIVDPHSGNDVVLDFEARGKAQGAFDHLALMDIKPGQVHVADTAKGALVSWDTNADGRAEGSVLLQNVAKADLRQSDFMFVDEPGFVAGINDYGSHYIFPAA